MTPRQLRQVCSIEAIASLDNLFLAAWKARRGKSRRPDVEEWWQHRAQHLGRLQEALLSGGYQPGGYRFFEIHTPKRRLIAAAPFADRVVHHALCNLLAPVLERRFIARSFSCQLGKGTTAARECCRQLTNRHRFVLKCDVRKFFPNIDHAILLGKLARWIACPGALGLVEKLLGNHRTGGEVLPPLFAGDDLVEAPNRPRGLPIGNLTSQLWANAYLDALDHWVTETQRHGAYLRYTDDFLLFGDDKARLRELRSGIVEQLAQVRLKLAEPKSRLLATPAGVPFCGFRFLPGLRPRVLGATKRRFEQRRYALFARRLFQRLSLSVFAWYQFSREGNAAGLRRAYVCWPLAARLKRRQRRTSRVLRGGSWNNDPTNLRSAYRNNNTPDNRNNNIGFRCVFVGGSSPKAEGVGVMPGGLRLPGQSQESSLTAVPAPVG
ncbi:MAG: reverse transcriptase domain-containing protein [Verrucomicrobia bacterium]|nr:reverse transcriptase domain-containing protein [Verrucomicrobiota bacterium]